MGDDIKAKESFIERRNYFRVNDVLPIVAKKIESLAGKKSRVLSGYFSGLGTLSCVEDITNGLWNPKLVKMLSDMNSKLDLILDRLFGDTEETASAEAKEVTLSVSGMCFITQNKFDLGDLMEVKIFLPIHPPVWIVIYGNITRSDEVDNCGHEIAIQFNEIEDEVRDILSYYTIKRQRELIMKQRYEI